MLSGFVFQRRTSLLQVCRTRVGLNDADFRVNCRFNEQKRAALPSDWLFADATDPDRRQTH